MKRLFWRTVAAGAAAVCVAALGACGERIAEGTEAELEPVGSFLAGRRLPEEVVELPFETTTDIKASFSEGEPEFEGDGDKSALTTEELENGEYDSSEEAYDMPGEWETMALQCTWTASAKIVYIGFLSEDTGEVYELSFVGGSITGRLALDCLPEGRYKVILYSVNNEKTDAFLAYQFQ